MDAPTVSILCSDFKPTTALGARRLFASQETAASGRGCLCLTLSLWRRWLFGGVGDKAMRFPSGNKILWATIVEEKGKKVADVIEGLPCDMEFTLHKINGSYWNGDNLIFMVGQKPGSRPLLVTINSLVLTSIMKAEFRLEERANP